MTEIARSFSWTVQVQQFSPRQFFCSQKIECPLDEVDEWSERLFKFCKATVEKDVKEYIEANLPEDQRVIEIDKIDKGIEL